MSERIVTGGGGVPFAVRGGTAASSSGLGLEVVEGADVLVLLADGEQPPFVTTSEGGATCGVTFSAIAGTVSDLLLHMPMLDA